MPVHDITEDGYFDIHKFDAFESYESKEAYFEKFHFKLMNPPSCTRLVSADVPVLLKIPVFKGLYENLVMTVTEEKEDKERRQQGARQTEKAVFHRSSVDKRQLNEDIREDDLSTTSIEIP